jgi:hypothetical protein
VRTSTPEFQELGILAQPAIMVRSPHRVLNIAHISKAGASFGRYVSAHPPPKPELAGRLEPTAAGTVDRPIHRSNVEEFRNRALRELDEASPSVIPGIPEAYVYTAQQVSLCSPNDIWNFRHLKPLQRQQEYLHLRGLCENLELFSSDEHMSRGVLASIRSKSAQLHYAERNFYRIHMRRMFMDNEYDKTERYLPWSVIIKHQSFTTRITEDGQIERVRDKSDSSPEAASPATRYAHNLVESHDRDDKNMSPQLTSSSCPKSSPTTLVSPSPSSQGEQLFCKRDADDSRQQPAPKKKRRIDVVPAQHKVQNPRMLMTDEHNEGIHSNEDPANVVSDNVIYEQNRIEIEADWAKNPFSRSKAPEWEKLAYWKSRHPLVDRGQAAAPTQRSATVQKRPQVAKFSTPSHVMPVANLNNGLEQQDWEDAGNPST